MEVKIYQVLRKHRLPLKKREELMVDLLDLYSASKRHLVESILEEMEGKHPEYYKEVVEDFLDDDI